MLALQVIKKEMDEGVDSRRVGLISTGAPARQHSKIFTEDGEEVLFILQISSCLVHCKRQKFVVRQEPSFLQSICHHEHQNVQR